jgi:hypothetical protein
MKKVSNWLFWDWKSIFRAIVLFSGLFLLFAFLFLYPDWKRNKEVENYDGLTKGIILSIEPIEEISMSEYGNKTVVHFYSIHYRFKAGSKTYEISEQVPNTIKIHKSISLMENRNQYEVTVKYDSKKPKNSQVQF